MKEVLRTLGFAAITVGLLFAGLFFLVGKPNFDAEAVCTQKGGHLVRTYSSTVCAKLEVIK